MPQRSHMHLTRCGFFLFYTSSVIFKALLTRTVLAGRKKTRFVDKGILTRIDRTLRKCFYDENEDTDNKLEPSELDGRFFNEWNGRPDFAA